VTALWEAKRAAFGCSCPRSFGRSRWRGCVRRQHFPSASGDAFALSRRRSGTAALRGPRKGWSRRSSCGGAHPPWRTVARVQQRASPRLDVRRFRLLDGRGARLAAELRAARRLNPAARASRRTAGGPNQGAPVSLGFFTSDRTTGGRAPSDSIGPAGCARTSNSCLQIGSRSMTDRCRWRSPVRRVGRERIASDTRRLP